METCVPLTKDMLKDPVHLQVEDEELDFARAKQLADKEAKKLTADPMLLAWYNAKTGEFSPPVTCCGEDRPTWLIYAESRGGTICIDINEEEFVFVYRPFD
jgi:hypothetical protein